MEEDVLRRSPALWNRNRLDLQSDELLAQILDRGELCDWRALYELARSDRGLRVRIERVVRSVPVAMPRFWLAALRSLGEDVALGGSVPSDPDTEQHPGEHHG